MCTLVMEEYTILHDLVLESLHGYNSKIIHRKSEVIRKVI
jgi:hypothetical protein